MIDNQDKQTQPLDLGAEPKRRGRPAKKNALSNAERQRLYRERQKAQRNEKPESHKVPYDEVVAIAQELGERCKAAEARVKELEYEVAKWKKFGIAAERARQVVAEELMQRNESPSRLNEGMKKLIQDVHDVADAIEGSTWRIQKKSRGGKWKTLMGNYWTEAQAIDAIMDLPGGGPHDQYRAIEVNLKVED